MNTISANHIAADIANLRPPNRYDYAERPSFLQHQRVGAPKEFTKNDSMKRPGWGGTWKRECIFLAIALASVLAVKLYGIFG